METTADTAYRPNGSDHAVEHPRMPWRRRATTSTISRPTCWRRRPPAHVRAAGHAATGGRRGDRRRRRRARRRLRHRRPGAHAGDAVRLPSSSASTTCPEFCDAAAELNRRSGLDDLIEIRAGGRHGAAVRGRRVHRRLDAARLDERRRQGADVRRDAQGAWSPAAGWRSSTCSPANGRPAAPPGAVGRRSTSQSVLASPEELTRQLVTRRRVHDPPVGRRDRVGRRATSRR